MKTKVLHLFRYAECNYLSLTCITVLHDNCLYWSAHRRDSGVILLASGGASMKLLQIWGTGSEVDLESQLNSLHVHTDNMSFMQQRAEC